MTTNVILFSYESDCTDFYKTDKRVYHHFPSLLLFSRRKKPTETESFLRKLSRIQDPDAKVSNYIGRFEDQLTELHPSYTLINIDGEEKIIEFRVAEGTISCVIRNNTCTDAWLFTD